MLLEAASVYSCSVGHGRTELKQRNKWKRLSKAHPAVVKSWVKVKHYRDSSSTPPLLIFFCPESVAHISFDDQKRKKENHSALQKIESPAWCITSSVDACGHRTKKKEPNGPKTRILRPQQLRKQKISKQRKLPVEHRPFTHSCLLNLLFPSSHLSPLPTPPIPSTPQNPKTSPLFPPHPKSPQ